MAVLYLVPAPLSENTIEKVLPQYVISVIQHLKQFIVEDIRSARRYLTKLKHQLSMDDINFLVLNEHTHKNEIPSLLPFLLSGDTGLMSEAGLPCLADPGANLVYFAHLNGIQVIPLTGPSSIFMALIASGLNGQSFAFVGYLPVKQNERRAYLRVLEKRSATERQTQIFIETPYRNESLLDDILKTCSSETSLTIAADITSAAEFIATKSIRQWKKHLPVLKKIPTVFLLQA